MAKVLRNGQIIDVPDSEFAVDPAVEAERMASEVRSTRDGLLASSDWVVTRAKELGQPVPIEWYTYRGDLRQIPEQAGFPHTVEWPVKPE